MWRSRRLVGDTTFQYRPGGHWTKLQFGKSSPKTALPPQDQDNEVQLTIPTRREIASKEKRRAWVKAVEHVAEQLTPPQFEISAELLKLHPLVKATNTYLQRLPKVIKKYQKTNWLDRGDDFESPPYEQHRRYFFKVPGGLVVTASLEKMDWVPGTNKGVDRRHQRGTGQAQPLPECIEFMPFARVFVEQVAAALVAES